MKPPLHKLLLLAVLNFSLSNAGPVGPLPNVTSSDLGIKEGSCALGDVVYMSGDDFPGATPCELCRCNAGDVSCSKQRCEPRPGCKALHRPDHCCPTYQCDCEQEGRVYANGEKLVDPNDPCRVCYCQGGEVVCRRIACFVRDDCRPRLVPGRCCPEYDNCPLRGVTSLPGISSLSSSVSSIEEISINLPPLPSKEPIKQEITIKEITPVSEIPVKAEVKIKEILPSSNVEDIEIPSSKSPLIPREATSERIPENEELKSLSEASTAKTSFRPLTTNAPFAAVNYSADLKSINDALFSKIMSTTKGEPGDINPSKIPNIVPLMGSPSQPNLRPTVLTTKSPMLEDEDAQFDHNPAFPPIPDDLSVVGNHEDENIPEQNVENEQVPNHHEMITSNKPDSTVAPVLKELLTSTSIIETSSVRLENTERATAGINNDKFESTEASTTRNQSMINLRSVIPTEILDAPSLISNETTDELFDVTEPSVFLTTGEQENFAIGTTESEIKFNESNQTDGTSKTNDQNISSTAGTVDTTLVDTNEKTTEVALPITSVRTEMSSSTSKVSDITSQTELSSLPIETSDQNPHENTDKDITDRILSSTTDNLSFDSLPTGRTADSEVITVLADVPSVKGDRSYEYIETTEFIVTPYDPSDSATEAVELIKIFPNGEESSAIVLRPKNRPNNNMLTDFINLVGDVASMPDHTEKPTADIQTTNSSSMANANSEELIPVNAGYKSKNKNWNLNSITEIPLKNKNPGAGNKQKVVEIEDDESDSITDSPPPYDRVEPTTRRPIIDNVSDTKTDNTGKHDRKDIEIITQSYVPTINKHPTKVVLKEDDDALVSAEFITSIAPTASNVPADNSKFLIEITNAADEEDTTTDAERILDTTETIAAAQ